MVANSLLQIINLMPAKGRNFNSTSQAVSSDVLIYMTSSELKAFMRRLTRVFKIGTHTGLDQKLIARLQGQQQVSDAYRLQRLL